MLASETKTAPASAQQAVSDDKIGAGSQTLMRGLDVIEAVGSGNATLADLCEQLSLSKSTAHRLASALVARGFLSAGLRGGAYRLGPKMLQFGEIARTQNGLVQVARPHIERLAEQTSDTIHLGVLNGDEALYVDKVPGQRRINISSQVGERQPLTTTGLGKALMLDHDPTFWRERWQAEQGGNSGAVRLENWLVRMATYATEGRAYDLEENEDRIRCVAAPIRGVHGEIVAALSVSSAAQYMDDQRMELLSDDVKAAAAAISDELGYHPKK